VAKNAGQQSAAPEAAISADPAGLPSQESLRQRRRQLNQTIFRLILGWMGVLVLLTAIGLATHLEWARPRVEQAMQEAFHRPVRLGNISWMLGFNGLSIGTDRLTMTENDGKPFIVAADSEIGVAFIPLLQKRVIIKHVQFHHPEVFATQTAAGKWNFSDLLVEGPEIHYVEVDNGVFHLRNRLNASTAASVDSQNLFSNSRWRSYDLQDVCIKLIFPSKNQHHSWPFYLTFKLPHEHGQHSYLSTVSLTLMCNGSMDDWKQHPCKVDVLASKLAPEDWRPFLLVPDDLDGLISLKFHGEGTPGQSINGTLTGSAEEARWWNGTASFSSAPQISFSSNIECAQDQLRWDKLKLKVASIDIESHGLVDGWRTANPSYSAQLSADLKNILHKSDSSIFKFLPGFPQLPSQQQSSGSAQMELTLEGDGAARTISTRLKADGLPLSHLLTGDADKAEAPLLSLFKLEPNTPISGQVVVDPDQTIRVKDLRLPVNGSTLAIDGIINAAHRSHDVTITSQNLVLDKFDASQLEEKLTQSIFLSGKIDLGAHLLCDQLQQTVDVQAKLKDASLSSSKENIAYRLNGLVTFNGKAIDFQHVSGTVDNDDHSTGSIFLDGTYQTGKQAACALSLTGKQVDIADLLKICRVSGLPLSASAIGNLSGTAKEVAVSIKGSGKNPQCQVHLTPGDMHYRLSSSANGVFLKPLKITGGSINISGDRLDLNELPITAQSGKLTLTAAFLGLGKDLNARSIHASTAGIGVDELQNYLCSPDLPSSTTKTFANVLSPLQISNAKGKVSGEWQFAVGSRADAPSQMSGSIAFSGISGKVFQHVPFDKMSATVNVHDESLQIPELVLVSGVSRVRLSGEVKGIQDKPQWTLVMGAHGKPEDLLACLPAGIGRGIQGAASANVALHATITGDLRGDRITFVAQARPGCNLHISGQGWDINQPLSQPMSMDGTLVSRSADGNESVKLENAHMQIADAVLQTGGKYEWACDSDQLTSMELTMSTPQPVSAPILLSAIVPGLDTTGGSGTIKGSLAFAGMGQRLLTHGDFVLKDVSLPAVNVKNVDGKLHSPRWSIVGTTDHGIQSQLAIQISNATVAGVPVRDLSGTVMLESGNEPCLTLNDGQGTVAGGHVSVLGTYRLNNQNWSLDLGMSQLQIDEFVSDLIEHSGEVTGLASGHVKLESRGTDWNQAIANLKGEGHVEVAKGTVPKVAALQEKLSQANLLHQGIFGFNINNVLQTVLPGKAGKFREANASFSIVDGVVSIDHLNFVGSDMRLRAAGDWNIPHNALNVEVDGNIPRVASSILPGPVGQVSRNLTIQKAVRVVTFNKLEALPSVPLLGDIAADDPRAFTFKVACDLDKPDAMQHSISKTFRWLPNKPNASAHPIPRPL
jgi:hypothetical protein